MTGTPEAARFRWLVLAVFVLSSAINYLDRATLSALAPLVRAEFKLSNAQYGWIAPAAGVLFFAAVGYAVLLIFRGLHASLPSPQI